MAHLLERLTQHQGLREQQKLVLKQKQSGQKHLIQELARLHVRLLFWMDRHSSKASALIQKPSVLRQVRLKVFDSYNHRE